MTNYCTHTSINITPHLPLKVVMGLIIIFLVLYVYRIRWCSAQTQTGMGHLRKPPGVELIPAVD
jgi:hypothetical protein